MRNLLITLCYTNLEVIREGVQNCLQTIGLVPDKYVLVDHRYPGCDWMKQTRGLIDIAEEAFKSFGVDIDIIRPSKNRGAHGGFTWALKELEIEDDDVIIGVDPDCNILTNFWGAKAVEIIRTDPTIGCISLLHEHIMPHNEDHWQKELSCGTMIGFLDKPEMFNVTTWRGKFLRETGGLLANLDYYGTVESAMRPKAIQLGYRMGYMLDYRETMHKVAHDAEYNEWKGAHVAQTYGKGYKGNFDQFLKDKKAGRL